MILKASVFLVPQDGEFSEEKFLLSTELNPVKGFVVIVFSVAFVVVVFVVVVVVVLVVNGVGSVVSCTMRWGGIVLEFSNILGFSVV